MGRIFYPAAIAAVLLAMSLGLGGAARAQAEAQSDAPQPFTAEELLGSGHRFFGSVSRGLAMAIEEAVRRWGQPNGYILGQEGAAALLGGGLRYGEGTLYTRNAGDKQVFWQGPSFGIGVGLAGSRTMILVYNLPSVDSIFQRFGGVDGSAFLVGGFSMTALTAQNIVVVPISSGVGLKIGLNVGYLKFSQTATWNPF